MTEAQGRISPVIGDRLVLPVIAAPMFRISGPDLVVATCRAGIIGAFPTANAGDAEGLDAWLAEIKRRLAPVAGERARAPYCPNLIIRDPRCAAHAAVLARWRPEIVITSVGSPAPVLSQLHDAGSLVFADVASMRHAEKAIADGVDGLVLLTAGAGGNTGWLNPFAFIREVRAIFGGPIVLAGGITDGISLRAAELLGCDLAYVGTRFIASYESLAPPEYREMITSASMDDVILTRAFTGIDANILRQSIERVGLSPGQLPPAPTPEEARQAYGPAARGPRRWREIWSAGHSVSAVHEVRSAQEIVEELVESYRKASAP